MDKVQVILKEDVANLGRSGEVASVKPGYARNYLIPQGLAVLATRKNVAQLDHEKKAIEARAAKVLGDAQAIAARLDGVSLHIGRQAGEEGKLFGSVTSKDIEDALTQRGLVVDRKKIHLAEPLKSLGDHEVEIRIARDVTAKIKVTVVAV